MKSITEEMRFRQRLCEYALKMCIRDRVRSLRASLKYDNKRKVIAEGDN